MTFKLPTADEKADYVLNQFNRIAGRYDLTNDAISLGMHRLWKERAVDALEIMPAGRYLDVCCGTGDLTLRIANRLSTDGKVVGVDFAHTMLAFARLRTAENKAAAEKTNFVQGDALDLPFSDNYFDGAVISFGLRNLADFGKGLAEMARVVKPGGRIISLDLGRPTNYIFKPVYYFYFGKIVPIIGQILQNDRSAYTYLPKSLDIYLSPSGVSKLFEQAGLKAVKHIPLAMGSVSLHSGRC